MHKAFHWALYHVHPEQISIIYTCITQIYITQIGPSTLSVTFPEQGNVLTWGLMGETSSLPYIECINSVKLKTEPSGVQQPHKGSLRTVMLLVAFFEALNKSWPHSFGKLKGFYCYLRACGWSSGLGVWLKTKVRGSIPCTLHSLHCLLAAMGTWRTDQRLDQQF